MAKKTVLIADDDQALATAIAVRCKTLGLDAIVCQDGIKAYQAVVKQPPDLLILDVNMPGADGLYLIEELAREQGLPPIPAIVLTGKTDEATAQRCENLGAHYVWKGLDTWEKLKPIICKLMALDDPDSPSEAAQPDAASAESAQVVAENVPTGPKILVVDDDPDVSKAIKIRLEAYGAEVFRALNGMQGYWTALKEQPDIIIMDYCMPDGYGNVLLGKLRSHSLTKETPVIVLTGQSIGASKDYALERALLGLGACAFLTKPLDFSILLKELRRYVIIPEAPAPSL